MSIYAANNLLKGIQKYSNSGGALLGGVIANSITSPYQKAIIDDFVAQTKTQVMEYHKRIMTGFSLHQFEFLQVWVSTHFCNFSTDQIHCFLTLFHFLDLIFCPIRCSSPAAEHL